MNFIGTRPQPCRLTDIADDTELDSGTVYRILSELVREGYIYKNSVTRRYALGVQMFHLGASELARVSAIDSAQPYLQRIAGLTGTTVVLGSRSGIFTKLHKLVPSPMHRPLGADVAEAGLIDAHATALGKMLLAQIGTAELRMLYQNAGFNRHTDRTLTAIETLQRDLQQTRQRGYALEQGEYRADLHGIGLPVRGPVGQVTLGVWLVSDAEKVRHIVRTGMIGQLQVVLDDFVAETTGQGQAVNDASPLPPVAVTREKVSAAY